MAAYWAFLEMSDALAQIAIKQALDENPDKDIADIKERLLFLREHPMRGYYYAEANMISSAHATQGGSSYGWNLLELKSALQYFTLFLQRKIAGEEFLDKAFENIVETLTHELVHIIEKSQEGTHNDVFYERQKLLISALIGAKGEVAAALDKLVKNQQYADNTQKISVKDFLLFIASQEKTPAPAEGGIVAGEKPEAAPGAEANVTAAPADKTGLPAGVKEINGARMLVNGSPQEQLLTGLSVAVNAAREELKKQNIVSVRDVAAYACEIMSDTLGYKVMELMPEAMSVKRIFCANLFEALPGIEYPSGWKRAWGEEFVDHTMVYFEYQGLFVVVDLTAPDYTAGQADAEVFALPSKPELSRALSLRYGGASWLLGNVSSRDLLEKYIRENGKDSPAYKARQVIEKIGEAIRGYFREQSIALPENIAASLFRTFAYYLYMAAQGDLQAGQDIAAEVGSKFEYTISEVNRHYAAGLDRDLLLGHIPALLSLASGIMNGQQQANAPLTSPAGSTGAHAFSIDKFSGDIGDVVFCRNGEYAAGSKAGGDAFIGTVGLISCRAIVLYNRARKEGRVIHCNVFTDVAGTLKKVLSEADVAGWDTANAPIEATMIGGAFGADGTATVEGRTLEDAISQAVQVIKGKNWVVADFPSLVLPAEKAKGYNWPSTNIDLDLENGKVLEIEDRVVPQELKNFNALGGVGVANSGRWKVSAGGEMVQAAGRLGVDPAITQEGAINPAPAPESRLEPGAAKTPAFAISLQEWNQGKRPYEQGYVSTSKVIDSAIALGISWSRAITKKLAAEWKTLLFRLRTQGGLTRGEYNRIAELSQAIVDRLNSELGRQGLVAIESPAGFRVGDRIVSSGAAWKEPLVRIVTGKSLATGILDLAVIREGQEGLKPATISNLELFRQVKSRKAFIFRCNDKSAELINYNAAIIRSPRIRRIIEAKPKKESRVYLYGKIDVHGRIIALEGADFSKPEETYAFMFVAEMTDGRVYNYRFANILRANGRPVELPSSLAIQTLVTSIAAANQVDRPGRLFGSGALKNIINGNEALEPAEEQALLDYAEGRLQGGLVPRMQIAGKRTVRIDYELNDEIGKILGGKGIAGAFNLAARDPNTVYVFVQKDLTGEAKEFAVEHEFLEIEWRERARARGAQALNGFTLDQAAHILAWGIQINRSSAQATDFIKSQIGVVTDVAILEGIANADRARHAQLRREIFAGYPNIDCGVMEKFERSVKDYAQSRISLLKPQISPHARLASVARELFLRIWARLRLSGQPTEGAPVTVMKRVGVSEGQMRRKSLTFEKFIGIMKGKRISFPEFVELLDFFWKAQEKDVVFLPSLKARIEQNNWQEKFMQSMLEEEPVVFSENLNNWYLQLDYPDRHFLWLLFSYKYPRLVSRDPDARDDIQSMRTMIMTELSEVLQDMNKAGIHRKARVLDMGCGVGGNMILSLNSIGEYRERMEVYGIDFLVPTRNVDGVNFLQGDVMEMDNPERGYPAEYFDLIYEIAVIGHLTNPELLEKLMASVMRVLRTGGRFMINDNLSVPMQEFRAILDKVGVPYSLKGKTITKLAADSPEQNAPVTTVFAPPVRTPAKDDFSALNPKGRLTVTVLNMDPPMSLANTQENRNKILRVDLNVCLGVAAVNVRTGERFISHLIPTGYLKLRSTYQDQAIIHYLSDKLDGIRGSDWRVMVVSSAGITAGYDLVTANYICGYLVHNNSIGEDNILLNDNTVVQKSVTLDEEGVARVFYYGNDELLTQPLLPSVSGESNESPVVPPGRTLTQPLAQPQMDRRTPAFKLIDMLGINELVRGEQKEVFRSSRYGSLVYRVSLPPVNSSETAFNGLSWLLTQIVPKDRRNEAKELDLLFHENRLIGIFPVLARKPFNFAKKTPEYLDLAAYYFAIPALNDADAERKWKDFEQQFNQDFGANQEYSYTEQCAAKTALGGDFSPYVYLEIDKETGRVIGKDIFATRPDAYSPTIRELPPGFAPNKHQIVIPVLPTVFSPSGRHAELARGYRQSLYDGEIAQGNSVLVVGPGSGVDSWVAWLRSQGKICAIGINPLEILNLRLTSEIAGFEVEAVLADNIISRAGQPVFNRKFDRVCWDMPSYAPGFSVMTEADADLKREGLAMESWDRDWGGFTARRLAQGLPLVLSANGKAILWNMPYWHTVQGQEVDEVKEILSSASKAALENIVSSATCDVRAFYSHEENVAVYIIYLEYLTKAETATKSAPILPSGKDSGSVPPNDAGGINFTAMPIVTQQIADLSTKEVGSGSSQALTAVIETGAGSNQALRQQNRAAPDNEWLQIQRLLQSGIIPSAQRLKEYALASCAGPDCQEQVDRMISCIADILRLEEEDCAETNAQIRQILVLLEKHASPDQLQLEIRKI